MLQLSKPGRFWK